MNNPTWNEKGELVIDIFADSPVINDTDDELDEEETKHTYATIDCGGDCGNCVALIVDGNIISGPPFHPNCQCSLTIDNIKQAKYHKSHLHQDVAPNLNCDLHDIEWLKNSLYQLGFYEPDIRAGESSDNLNPYPNKNLFDAIEHFRRVRKIKAIGAVKPGHWTEIKINEDLKNHNKQTDMKMDSNDVKFEQAYKQLKTREGGYTTGKKQQKDEPTNIGIKQSTLDRYSAKHPDKNFPQDVKYLTESQAKEIYKTEYWDNTKIPQIENDRIRDAVFDMNVMGGAGKVIQRALNSYTNAGLRVDGVIGTKTITAINAIPTDKVADFMTVVKSERINYLKGTDNWSTSKNGWQTRTNTY